MRFKMGLLDECWDAVGYLEDNVHGFDASCDGFIRSGGRCQDQRS